MTKLYTGEGILRKISGGKLRGGLGIAWSGLEIVSNLETVIWMVCAGVAAVKMILPFILWLF